MSEMKDAWDRVSYTEYTTVFFNPEFQFKYIFIWKKKPLEEMCVTLQASKQTFYFKYQWKMMKKWDMVWGVEMLRTPVHVVKLNKTLDYDLSGDCN